MIRVSYYTFMKVYHKYKNEPIFRAVLNKYDIYKSIVEVLKTKGHNITLMSPGDISSLSCLIIKS